MVSESSGVREPLALPSSLTLQQNQSLMEATPLSVIAGVEVRIVGRRGT